MRLLNVSIHRIFYQNRFVNEYARKKKAKISRVTEFCFVGFRRTKFLIKLFSGISVDDKNGGFLVNEQFEACPNLWVAGDAAAFLDPQLGR